MTPKIDGKGKAALCLIVGLLVVALPRPRAPTAAPVTGDSDVADVTLTVEPWASVYPTPPVPPEEYHIVMMPVTADWFCQDLKTTGSTLLSVEANEDVTLRCPKMVQLTDGGTYDVDADISLIGVNLAYHCGDYWCLDFAAGSHIDETTLQTSIKKHWTVADQAGTYTGTILLELYTTP